MDPDAGRYYEICGRLRGQLSRHHFGQGNLSHQFLFG